MWLLLAILYLGAEVSVGGRIERDGVLDVAVGLTALLRSERLPVGQYGRIRNMGMTSQWQLGWAMRRAARFFLLFGYGCQRDDVAG